MLNDEQIKSAIRGSLGAPDDVSVTIQSYPSSGQHGSFVASDNHVQVMGHWDVFGSTVKVTDEQWTDFDDPIPPIP